MYRMDYCHLETSLPYCVIFAAVGLFSDLNLLGHPNNRTGYKIHFATADEWKLEKLCRSIGQQ